MAKYELSIAENYVADWTYIEGVREIFQNALDREVENDGNDMYFEYDEDEEVLRIGNKTSVLDVSTLLLGVSSKTDKRDLIGQFGEGYKIATLVLTREGHKVTFYNYGAREVWRPRFVNSRRYKAKILTFFVDRKHVWNKVPSNDLIIEITNITKEQYEKIKESNLHLQDEGEVYDTSRGRILLEDRYKGKVYVNGLYVCDSEDIKYGYDFRPECIEVDRDRKAIRSFELTYEASRMWSLIGSDLEHKAIESIKEGTSDTKFMASGERYRSISDKIGREFVGEYGEDAVPIENQWDMQNVEDGLKPVVVGEVYKNMVKDSGHLREIKRVYKKSAKERLEEWIVKYESELSSEALEDFDAIIDDME